MIRKVAHHMKLKTTSHATRCDETADAALLAELAFAPKNVLDRYNEAELRAGKTPDFKLLKDGAVCGFCEMKSPGDDYISET
jgi:hypothetical protein